MRHRKLIAVLGLALTMVLSAGLSATAQPKPAAAARPPAANTREMSLGNPKAKVTVVEYASLSCPHCARWNEDVWPAFKAKYVDTGKVRYVFREIITEPAQLAEAGFLLSRCVTPNKYFPTLDRLFRAQEGIYNTGDMRTPFMSIGAQAGLTEQQITACVSDEKALAALQLRVQTFAEKDHVEATPTFIVGDKKLEGEQPLAALDAAIDAAITAAQAKK